MAQAKQKLIIIAGPTASGKTGLATEAAERLDGEIIGADSMQIYKYMDIGTAKPTKSERARVPHHMVDFLDPAESYSVADYCLSAHKIIADIAARGKVPVMCGGTGLYISSVADDITFGEFETDYALRDELKDLAEKEGGEKLLDILAEFDEESAKKLHPNNVRRIIRAIEFYKTTGIPISEHQKKTREKESRYEPVMIGIKWEREKLYERINKRVDIMIESGLFKEVEALLERGCTREMNSMQGIGYKEVIDCIEGRMGYDETIEQIKQNSRRYAKRQLTWFGRDRRMRWLSQTEAIEELCRTDLRQ